MLSVRSSLSLGPKFVRFASNKASALSNGLLVASHEDGYIASSLSIAVRAGSRFEDSSNLGSSLILKSLAFSDTTQRTKTALTRIMENTGSNLEVSLSREVLTIRADFLSHKKEEVFDLVASIITSPNLSYHRVESAKQNAIATIDASHEDADGQFLDQIHKTAFRTQLGNPLYPSARHVEAATVESVSRFASKAFAPSNIAVVGYGVSHEELVGLTTSHFGSLKSGESFNKKASQYQGGETVTGALDEYNRHALVYEGVGLNSNEKYAFSVLQKILDGSSSVQGGKGSSRIAALGSVETFSLQYSDTGLFGFYVKSSGNDGLSIVNKAAEELKKLSSSVSEADLNAGKAKAKSSYLLNDSRVTIAENLSTQLLNARQITSSSDFIGGVDKVTASDVQKLASKLSQSKPTTIIAADL